MPMTVIEPQANAMDRELDREQLDQLGHAFAYENCAGSIESSSFELTEGSATWLDVHPEDIAPGGALFDCVRYLDARGLLVRHPERVNWIQLRDESEATR